jgi:hypothetical protein
MSWRKRPFLLESLDARCPFYSRRPTCVNGCTHSPLHASILYTPSHSVRPLLHALCSLLLL